MCSLVSVIIPFYNSENYLYDCLQSVRKQTYRNIEIILVDDGSRDGSYEICEKELKKDLCVSKAIEFVKANAEITEVDKKTEKAEEPKKETPAKKPAAKKTTKKTTAEEK